MPNTYPIYRNPTSTAGSCDGCQQVDRCHQRQKLLPHRRPEPLVKRSGGHRTTALHGIWLLLAGFLLLALASCGDDDSSADDNQSSVDDAAESIVVYSGRSEDLMSPLFEAFTAATGVAVEVRYAGSAELALLIETEGDASPADVFISQSPGALGYLSGEGRLTKLSDEVLNQVDDGFRGGDGTWVGITGRVRTLVYNSSLVDPADLPPSVLDLTAPAYKGRVAVAPTNSSFQDFVTAMRNELGEQNTADWLADMAANDSPNYPKNSAIVEAVGRGEVDMGLVNHYYNLRALEADPSVLSVNHFFDADDIGNLVIITGGVVLDTSDAPASAESLLAFLLEEEQQRTFVSHTQEYALVPGVAPPSGLPPLDARTVDTINFDLLGDELLGTHELIRSSGIER